MPNWYKSPSWGGAALDTLVDRHQGHLFRYFVHHTSDQEVAAELVKETMMRVLCHLDKIPDGCPFTPWLYGVARHVRGQWRRQNQMQRMVSIEQTLEEQGDALLQLRCTSQVEDACCEDDAISQTLSMISPLLREALLLHASIGLSALETAQIVHASESAVEQRISRAKALFRLHYAQLAREWEQ